MNPRVYSKRAGDERPPPGAVYVGRPTKWGNPFPLDDASNGAERVRVLREYETWLLAQPELRAAMRQELAGRDLVCWCAPLACHADVILRVANEPGRRTIIAGSREIVNPEVVVPIIEGCTWPIATVLSGCACGVDTIGAQWAEERDIPVERYPADWHSFGRAAGPLRNAEMAQRADALLLIWHGDSPGSRNMLERAQAHQLLIVNRIIERGPPL